MALCIVARHEPVPLMGGGAANTARAVAEILTDKIIDMTFEIVSHDAVLPLRSIESGATGGWRLGWVSIGVADPIEQGFQKRLAIEIECEMGRLSRRLRSTLFRLRRL